jgi:uncharacterized damage-inducible protein DinB
MLLLISKLYVISPTMKSHFLKLFDYDLLANRIMFGAIGKAGNPVKAVQLMNHLLVAQQIWLNRCKGLPPIAGALWTDEIIIVEPHRIEELYQGWAAYISSLAESDFDNILAYKNLRGDNFTNQLSDIFSHVMNHGTHHRAQIGQLLKLNNPQNLPGTDFILFVRQ